MKKIAIYGKGGIGKSTTTSNLSIALAEMGKRVFQIGCDPKSDSTCNLLGGREVETILGVLNDKKSLNGIDIQDLIHEGDYGVFCAECGGPKPGVGCAGRGIISAFEALEKLDVFNKLIPDIVLYDVLGDVVCGGFSMPLRNGYADEVYIVTSGEKMSLYAAKNIAMALKQFENRSYAKLKGIILNEKGIKNEHSIVDAFAESINTEVIIQIPRDELIQQCEDKNQTVVIGAKESYLAEVYRTLAFEISR